MTGGGHEPSPEANRVPLENLLRAWFPEASEAYVLELAAQARAAAAEAEALDPET